MSKKVNGSDQAIIGFNNHPLFSGMNLVGSWPLGFFISVGAFTYQKKSVEKFMRLLFPVRKLEKKISLSLSLSLKAPTALSPIYFLGLNLISDRESRDTTMCGSTYLKEFRDRELILSFKLLFKRKVPHVRVDQVTASHD